MEETALVLFVLGEKLPGKAGAEVVFSLKRVRAHLDGIECWR